MDLSVLGFSHKSSPVAAREALAVLPAERLLAELKAEGFGEAVVLGTCNRFELYVAGANGKVSDGTVRKILERLAGTPLSDHGYDRSGGEAVKHLFSVAAGLDSLVVGETEILGQVKDAYERALGAGMTGKALNVLFQRALYVGKSVRSDTGIAVGQTSVASVAVELAGTIFGELKDCSVLILGAGTMAEACARHLLSRKVRSISIANRTAERGRALAAQLKVLAVDWEAFPARLPETDIVIASTGAPAAVLTRALVEESLSARRGRSLFVIDIAMPRDVEDSVHGLEHVYLYRLEDLERIVAGNLAERGREIERAAAIVDAKSREFMDWARSAAEGKERSLRHAV